MKSSQSLLMSVPITVVIILTLTVAAATSIALFDNLVIVNAQPSQPNSTQPVTQQDEDEDAVIRQGTVTSEQDPLPGHEEHQRASILPLRQDGSIYTGVLTFAATEPVEVVVLHMQTLNETEEAILNGTEDGELGALITSQIDNQTSIALTIITPPYGDTPISSASIPFAGNALWLHSLEGTPFAASYAVSAQVVPAETLNNINNATLAVAADADADADAAEDADADAAEDADAEDGAGDGAANGNTTAAGA
jgi:hypothetical protein